jgi:hypothetical protein
MAYLSKGDSMKSFYNIHLLKILFISLIIALLSACTEVKKSEPAIYLIPEDYVGSLYIIFNAPNGEPPKYEGDSRVYKIPLSGVLVTQMDANEGWIENSQIQYFYVSDTGERSPISEDSSLKRGSTESGEEIRTMYGGGLGHTVPAYGCDFIYQNFTVGTDSEQTDSKYLFDIHEAIKIENIDGKFFDSICPNRKRSSPAIYLIPESYTGTFYIIYNVPKGSPSKYENGVPIFEVPSSGVLITQAKGSDVWEENPPNWHFYYVNNKGDRTPIKKRWHDDIENTPEFLSSTQLTTFHASMEGIILSKNCSVHAQLFAVGQISDIFDSQFQFDLKEHIDTSFYEKVCANH